MKKHFLFEQHINPDERFTLGWITWVIDTLNGSDDHDDAVMVMMMLR